MIGEDLAARSPLTTLDDAPRAGAPRQAYGRAHAATGSGVTALAHYIRRPNANAGSMRLFSHDDF